VGGRLRKREGERGKALQVEERIGKEVVSKVGIWKEKTKGEGKAVEEKASAKKG